MLLGSETPLGSGMAAHTHGSGLTSTIPAQVLPVGTAGDSFGHVLQSGSGGMTTTGMTSALDLGDTAGLRATSTSPREQEPFMVTQQALCSAPPAFGGAMGTDAMHAVHAFAFGTLPDTRRGFPFRGCEPGATKGHTLPPLMMPPAGRDGAAAAPFPHRSPSPAWMGLGVHPTSMDSNARAPLDGLGFGGAEAGLPFVAPRVPSPASMPAFLQDPLLDGDLPGMGPRMPSAPAFVGSVGPYGLSGFVDGAPSGHT